MEFAKNNTNCSFATAADASFSNELRSVVPDKQLLQSNCNGFGLNRKTAGVVICCLVMLFVYSTVYLNLQPSRPFQQGRWQVAVVLQTF